MADDFDRSTIRRVARDHEHPGDRTTVRPGQCRTLRCRGRTHPTRTKADGTKSYNRYCGRCLSRRDKLRNPIRYFFRKLKHRAAERGHEFTLTLEEWTRFVVEHDLLARRGRTATSLSIDRKKSSLGYSYDNLRVLTVSENSAKGAADDPDDGIDTPF